VLREPAWTMNPSTHGSLLDTRQPEKTCRVAEWLRPWHHAVARTAPKAHARASARIAHDLLNHPEGSNAKALRSLSRSRLSWMPVKSPIRKPSACIKYIASKGIVT